jgi:hypothetical protein
MKEILHIQHEIQHGNQNLDEEEYVILTYMLHLYFWKFSRIEHGNMEVP